MIFHANVDQKKAGVAILISDKTDFKTKAVKRDKEGQYIMIKGPIQEEDITVINIYAPNIRTPQYIRQMLTKMKGEINNNTIRVGDFNTRLTPMDRSIKQKINKETQTVNDTMGEAPALCFFLLPSSNRSTGIESSPNRSTGIESRALP